TAAIATAGGPSSSVTTSSTCVWETSSAFEPNQRRPSSHSPRRSSSSAVRSGVAISGLHVGVGILPEQEPEEAARREREQVGKLADARKARAPEHLLGRAPFVGCQIEFDGLRRARQV